MNITSSAIIDLSETMNSNPLDDSYGIHDDIMTFGENYNQVDSEITAILERWSAFTHPDLQTNVQCEHNCKPDNGHGGPGVGRRR